MVEKIRNTEAENQERYLVKFDADRDGKQDELIFNDRLDADNFESCYINEQKAPDCRTWMLLQAKNTTFFRSIEEIRLRREPSRECEEDYPCEKDPGTNYESLTDIKWRAGTFNAYDAIKRLWENTKVLVKTEPFTFIEALKEYRKSGFGVTQTIWMRLVFKKANEITKDGRLNEKQLDLLSNLAWRYKAVFNANIDNSFNPSMPQEKLKSVTETLDNTYFDPDSENMTETKYSYVLPDILLNCKEMIAMHRLFGGFVIPADNDEDWGLKNTW